MGFISDIFTGGDDKPKPRPVAPPPAPTPTKQQQAVKNPDVQQRKAQRESASNKRKKAGAQSTLLTGALGVQGGPTTQKKTLLGQ